MKPKNSQVEAILRRIAEGKPIDPAAGQLLADVDDLLRRGLSVGMMNASLTYRQTSKRWVVSGHNGRSAIVSTGETFWEALIGYQERVGAA